MFLPIKEEIFTSKEFKLETTSHELLALLEDFTNDPETFVETHFTSENKNLLPEVRKVGKQKPPTELITNKKTSTNPNHPKLEDLNF